MSECVGEIYGSFNSGTPDLDMSIFDYYTYGRGSNRYNQNAFKLPFPSGDNTCCERVQKCQKDLKEILQVAVKDVGKLYCRGEEFLVWEAGVVPDGTSVDNGIGSKDAEGQEEKVVCWQLTLSQEISHIDSSHAKDWDANTVFKY